MDEKAIMKWMENKLKSVLLEHGPLPEKELEEKCLSAFEEMLKEKGVI